MFYFTKQGFEKITQDLKKLQERRPNAVDQLQHARELGDLSENAAYKAARHELSTIDSRIRRIQRQLENAQVISAKTDGTIGIGNSVVLKKDDQKITYQIVGDFEADPIKKKISLKSPLGEKLFGKKQGDIIVVQTPASTITYTILKIS